MKKYIHITKADREFIAKALGITERMVFKAIRFEKGSNTELCDKIRRLAMQRGGIVMVVIPEIETLHDHDKVIRQYCPNGALIELDRNDGKGYVISKERQSRLTIMYWLKKLEESKSLHCL